jgi:NAD-dependent deacetylase
VDGLHQDAGSSHVIELHGSIRRWRCLPCGSAADVDPAELVQHLNRLIHALRSAFIPSLESVLPRCGVCGGPSRPDLVVFGERVKGMDRAIELAASCRALLVIGTSGLVEPASRVPVIAHEAGAAVVEVTRTPTFVDPDLRLTGRADRVLGILVRRVARCARRRAAA